MDYLFKNTRFLLLALVLIYAFVSSLGAMTMIMDKDGNMSACPFMNTDSICGMDVFEHIAIFQGMFSAIPEVSLSLSIAFVLLGLLLVCNHIVELDISQPLRSTFIYARFKPLGFNRILLALSDGILQPKIYV